jgi:predicted Zn-dependent protease
MVQIGEIVFVVYMLIRFVRKKRVTANQSDTVSKFLMPKIFRSIFLVIALGVCHQALGQPRQTFIPLATYTKSSTDMIATMKAHLTGELNAMYWESPNEFILAINKARLSALVKLFKTQQIVKDSLLEGYVTRVLNNLLAKNAFDRNRARRVFILRSPFVNAVCYGRGIYFVTTALLGRVYSEDQLAFALAHELAHDDLGHVQERIRREAEIQLAKKSNEQLRKMFSGTIELEDIEEYRKLVYGVSRHTRARELEADSLGFIFFTNAGYRAEASSEMIDVLEHWQNPKYKVGAELFLPFDSENYPLQLYWFNERLSVYSSERSSYLWESDSIHSHPAFQLRKDKLLQYPVDHVEAIELSQEQFDKVTELAEFEAIENAFLYGQYDRAMFSALQLINRYPDNTYLVSRIAAMLINMFAAETPEHFSPYVPRFTDSYSEELRLVNNFLLNLTHKEIGEIAYHFLKNPKFFNRESKSHYYLLWKISELTYRFDEREQVKKDFKTKFNESVSAFDYK